MAHFRSIGSAAAFLAAACWWMNPPRIAAQQGPVAQPGISCERPSPRRASVAS